MRSSIDPCSRLSQRRLDSVDRLRLKRRSARDELRALYRDAAYAYECGHLEGSGGRRAPISVLGDAEYVAYSAGRAAAKADGSATMSDDVFVAVLSRWARG